MYRWGKIRTSWAVTLALFALFLQALLPLGQALALSRSIGDGLSLPSIICTLSGPTLVYDATGEQIPPQEGGDVECPLCLVHANAGPALNNAAENVVPVPLLTQLRDEPIQRAVTTDGLSASLCSSRAPPSA